MLTSSDLNFLGVVCNIAIGNESFYAVLGSSVEVALQIELQEQCPSPRHYHSTGDYILNHSHLQSNKRPPSSPMVRVLQQQTSLIQQWMAHYPQLWWPIFRNKVFK